MKKKRILAFLLSITMILGMSICVYAKEDIDSIKLEQSPDYYSEKNQQEINELKERIEKEENEKGIVRSGYSKNLSVPIYQQVGHSNCGAASGRMVLKYKTGKDYGEDTLATAMEIPKYNFAYVYKVREVLNSYLGANSYKEVLTSSINFGSGLFSSINKDMPVVCHVNGGVLPNYNGAANPGHYVVAKGYYQNSQGMQGASTVTYHDPHYNNQFYGTYTTSVSVMQQAINNNAGFYIMGN